MTAIGPNALATIDTDQPRAAAVDRADRTVDDHVADAQISSREAFRISRVEKRVGPP